MGSKAEGELGVGPPWVPGGVPREVPTVASTDDGAVLVARVLSFRCIFLVLRVTAPAAPRSPPRRPSAPRRVSSAMTQASSSALRRAPFGIFAKKIGGAKAAPFYFASDVASDRSA